MWKASALTEELKLLPVFDAWIENSDEAVVHRFERVAAESHSRAAADVLIFDLPVGLFWLIPEDANDRVNDYVGFGHCAFGDPDGFVLPLCDSHSLIVYAVRDLSYEDALDVKGQPANAFAE